MRGRERGAQIGEHQVRDLELGAEGCVLGFEFCYAIVRWLICHLIGLSNNLRGMRPTTLTALAACALMLVGCSATQPAPEPAETPSASAVSVERELSDEPPTVYSDDLGISLEEYAFAKFADTQAMMNTHSGPAERIGIRESVEALHTFCEHDEPFKLHDDDVLNEMMSDEADALTCEALTNPQR